MVTTGMSPRLPTIHSTAPAEVMLTPLARTPSLMGVLVNGASHPTASWEIWQRVWPDLVSMKTYPLSSGGSGTAPAGGASVRVLVRDGAAVVGLDTVGLVVGKLGSVAVPEVVTGVPSMAEWQPEVSALSTTRLAQASRSFAVFMPARASPCAVRIRLRSKGREGLARRAR